MTTVGKLKRERITVTPISAIELAHFERDSDLDAELERLIEGAPRKRHA